MPFIHHSWSKREVKPPTPEVSNVEAPPVAPVVPTAPVPAAPEVPAESLTTELPGLVTSTESGGVLSQTKTAIFGNKKYHPSHGRTTPFPEPGTSYRI